MVLVLPQKSSISVMGSKRPFTTGGGGGGKPGFEAILYSFTTSSFHLINLVKQYIVTILFLFKHQQQQQQQQQMEFSFDNTKLSGNYTSRRQLPFGGVPATNETPQGTVPLRGGFSF
ncbi:hypothetical protein DFA_00961 [Cavenderia fasciculata]|uniref:Uncharacterized protein n=1 Tax=Cavenderia fasciculata TaxID=261658 RepID=F4PUR7_CACFS|nr:uncharacterized protein DFA_00961 [Cavenderia fasciculata]EGG21086.1 hypothetical protein DFA_00961 [Cavenderia fasciculata]|eukprot:XP_004358936.1 hypothetical protein DFA_00961 [Cavenderia fasciculata]